MLSRILVCITLLCCQFICSDTLAASSRSEKAAKASEPLLLQLDSILENHQYYIDRKEARIASLKSSLSSARSDSQKLDLFRCLYKEYEVYDSDSALSYAARASRMADRLYASDSKMKSLCLIDEAYILGILGFFEDALLRLEKVSTTGLDIDTKVKYFESAEYIHSMRALYLQGCRKKPEVSEGLTYSFRDSLRNFSDFTRPELLWIPVALQIDHNGPEVPEQVLKALVRSVESDSEPDRQKATNAYWLAHYYKSAGDETRWVRYITMSAINDALIENREIAAITELADWLFNNGDRLRSYNYYVYSSRQSNSYHNRNRLLNLAEKLAEVRDAYDADVQTHNAHMRSILIVLLVLTIVLIVIIALFIKDNHRLKQTRAELSEVNARLKNTVSQRDQAIHTLEKANRRLSESNEVKRGVLAMTFQLTTHYINMLDDYRKKLLRKYKLKQYADIGTMLDNQDLTKDQYREFYSSFDRTILSIFPDFVNEYNAEAPDDIKVDADTVERSQTLNTRLRIHALRRLGVDKSAEIAKMLNVSIRTVYNNRNSVQSEPAEMKI